MAAKSVLCLSPICHSHKSCNLAEGKFVVGQGKHREFKIQFEWVLCSRPGQTHQVSLSLFVGRGSDR